ncbi:MAG: type II secretion system protein [Trueperella sp.]|nr:type II secretion system protein [Trueperella sp.]
MKTRIRTKFAEIRRKTCAGVTLIELLLAVAILGVLSVTVMAVLNVGIESWMTGTALADESHNADAVMEQVVMALRSAYYPEASEPNYEYGFMHEDGGEAPDAEDLISWVKVGNSLIGEDTPWAGAAHRVELFIGDVDGEPGLYVKAWQLVGQDDEFDPEEDVEPLLISDQVISFDCRMKDPDTKETIGEPYEWLDEWTPSNRIPTHLMISIAMKQQKDKEDPMEYTRMVEIPMAAMSWNPIQTGGPSRRPGERNRPEGGNRPGGEGIRAPGGGNGGGGVTIRPVDTGDSRINRQRDGNRRPERSGGGSDGTRRRPMRMRF